MNLARIAGLQVALLFAVFAVHCLLVYTETGVYNVKNPTLSDMFHLAISTGTTNGYGDVAPVNLAARAVCWAQMIAAVYILLLVNK